MFVSGNRVGRTGLDDSLINGTDLYATIAALAGVNVTEVHDSRSFLPLLTTAGTHRDVQYSEIDDGSRDVWTLREQRYKLIENADGVEEMYDLLSDPYETNDLLRGTLKSDQTAVRVSLKAQADSIRGG
jgi:arylsulfatase A-like enzyme